MTVPTIVELSGLDEEFDDDLAKALLEIEFHRIIQPQEALEKSLYNFDLDTPEGIDRLLELLPIMDPDIINEVYQEIFPGYPVDTLVPRMARIELRGYLMDYLDGGEKEGQEYTAGSEEVDAESTIPEPEGLESRDRKSTRLNSSHTDISRMPSSA